MDIHVKDSKAPPSLIWFNPIFGVIKAKPMRFIYQFDLMNNEVSFAIINADWLDFVKAEVIISVCFNEIRRRSSGMNSRSISFCLYLNKPFQNKPNVMFLSTLMILWCSTLHLCLLILLCIAFDSKMRITLKLENSSLKCKFENLKFFHPVIFRDKRQSQNQNAKIFNNQQLKETFFLFLIVFFPPKKVNKVHLVKIRNKMFTWCSVFHLILIKI